MALKPTGLIVSSPIVWSRYVAMSQSGLALAPVAAALAGNDQDEEAEADGDEAVDELARAGGLVDRSSPAPPQIHANTGASVKMKNELTLWNQLLGNGMPKMLVSVLRSANRLSVEPACSKTDQKSADARNSTATTMSRLRSARV